MELLATAENGDKYYMVAVLNGLMPQHFARVRLFKQSPHDILLSKPFEGSKLGIRAYLENVKKSLAWRQLGITFTPAGEAIMGD